jgi:hypothetical protein
LIDKRLSFKVKWLTEDKIPQQLVHNITFMRIELLVMVINSIEVIYNLKYYLYYFFKKILSYPLYKIK